MRRTMRLALAGTLSVLTFLGVSAAVAADGLWSSNFPAAVAKAKAEKKLLLVSFIGSDWCVFCKKLTAEIFDKEVFKSQAPKKFVLVELDYPRTKELPKELKEQNAKLSQQYKVRGFPTVLLLDTEGHTIAKTGYRTISPEEYVKNLTELPQLHDSVVGMKAKAEKLRGLSRAKMLDEIVMGYEKLGLENEDGEKYGREIITLDPKNQAGLKVKYAVRGLLAEAKALKAQAKPAEAKAVCTKALAVSGLNGEQKQEVYFSQSECFFLEKDYPGLVLCLKKAGEAAPNSPKAAQIKLMLARYTPMAEAAAKNGGKPPADGSDSKSKAKKQPSSRAN